MESKAPSIQTVLGLAELPRLLQHASDELDGTDATHAVPRADSVEGEPQADLGAEEDVAVDLPHGAVELQLEGAGVFAVDVEPVRVTDEEGELLRGEQEAVVESAEHLAQLTICQARSQMPIWLVSSRVSLSNARSSFDKCINTLS